MAIELKPNAIPGASDGNKLVLQEWLQLHWNGTIYILNAFSRNYYA
ncbi:MAG: hypothetical protein IPN57_09775 [Ignavibacteria bacterium]|nr:hypothetical protein [Ignavibacteria bacterium]